MTRAGILAAGVSMTVLAAPGVAAAELGSTTTLNGETPPGVMAAMSDLAVIIDTVQEDGQRLLVQEGTRKPGTRSPIQYHDFAGQTCVTAGTITHFVEARDPVDYPSGTCYEIPPDVAMTAANLGTEDVRIIDTFLAPPDAPTIIVIEPGWPDLTDPTG